MNEKPPIKLGEDEEILFGPIRKASTTNLVVKSEDNPQEATHTSFRTVWITNHRVIIKSGESALTYPNVDVTTILINRPKKKGQEDCFNLLKLKTEKGRTVDIELPGVENEKEALLKEIFPNAHIEESKGVSGWLDRLLGE
jgi:hypothetical protein